MFPRASDAFACESVIRCAYMFAVVPKSACPYGQNIQPTTKLCDNQQLEDQSCPEFGRLADAAGCHGV